jgi:HAD superfamily hydrolase (TIGR01549 family)
MQPRYQVVSFDLDLTLIFHVKSNRQEQIVAVLVEHGYPVTLDDYRAASRIAREFYDVLGFQYAGNPRLLRHEYVRLILEGLGCSDPSIIDAATELYHAYDAAAGNFYVPDEARALLADVQAGGCRLVAISSNLMAVQRVTHCGLDGFFTAVFTPDLGHGKPELYRELIARMQVPPAQIIHIGDDPIRDVLAPRRFGMDAVLFDPHPKLAWPAIARSYDDLRSWIL